MRPMHACIICLWVGLISGGMLVRSEASAAMSLAVGLLLGAGASVVGASIRRRP